MKASDVVGRRIVAIEQSRDKASYGATFWNLDAIVLDDGTRIEFSVVELPHAASYGLEATAWKPKENAMSRPTDLTPSEQQRVAAAVVRVKAAALLGNPEEIDAAAGDLTAVLHEIRLAMIEREPRIALGEMLKAFGLPIRGQVTIPATAELPECYVVRVDAPTDAKAPTSDAEPELNGFCCVCGHSLPLCGR